MVEPNQYARIVEMEHTLETKQAAVGGLIACAYPWDESVCIVCNDEGLLNGMPYNRYVENYQEIAGPFFICGFTEDDFCGLTDEQAERYRTMFLRPELFIELEAGLMWFPYDDPRLPGAPEEAVQRFAQRGGMPNLCFCAFPPVNEIMIIHYGRLKCHAYPRSIRASHAKELADQWNALLGVTEEQQTAMMDSSIFGWDHPATEQTEPDNIAEIKIEPFPIFKTVKRQNEMQDIS